MDTGYNPCAGGKCDKLKERPNLELGAAVYVVFGIKDIDRSNVSFQHVLTDKVREEILYLFTCRCSLFTLTPRVDKIFYVLWLEAFTKA